MKGIYMNYKKSITILFFLFFITFIFNAHTFTLCVIPDTQGYVDRMAQKEKRNTFPCNQYEYYNLQMKYIAENSVINGGNIACALHVGDLVNEGKWYKYEWEKADEGISILDGSLPFGIVPGNHDYDYFFKKNVKPSKKRTAKYFNKYFGPNSKHFINQDWHGASDDGLNSFTIFEGGNKKFLAIGLEFLPNKKALNWAQSIINQNPNLPVILYTHGYLTLEKANDNQGKYLINNSFPDAVTPEEIFRNFVYENKNIFLVLCGHVFFDDFGENSRIDTNKYGYTVYSLLSNYQGRKHVLKRDYPESNADPRWNGDGWIRLMDFDLINKKIHVKTYSTIFDEYESDEDSDFFLPINWDWEERFESN